MYFAKEPANYPSGYFKLSSNCMLNLAKALPSGGISSVARQPISLVLNTGKSDI